jgi:hypothetical protein
MDVTNGRLSFEDALPVNLQYILKHPMCSGMRGAQVQNGNFAVNGF